MSCCGQRQRQRQKEHVKNYEWVFKHGTCIAAPTLTEAVNKFNEVSPKRFWASETYPGYWDVQLSDNIVHYRISAETVMQAVNKARWYTHLDQSLKTLSSTDNINEFGIGTSY